LLQPCFAFAGEVHQLVLKGLSMTTGRQCNRERGFCQGRIECHSGFQPADTAVAIFKFLEATGREFELQFGPLEFRGRENALRIFGQSLNAIKRPTWQAVLGCQDRNSKQRESDNGC
jgi:hypothetical protein